MRRVGWLALVLGMLAAPAWAAPRCTFEHARYAIREDPAFTAGFVPIPASAHLRGDIALFVRSSRSGRTFWFFFDGGSARYVSLISMQDPTKPGWTSPDGSETPTGPIRHSMTYLAADKALRFSIESPEVGHAAPDYFLLPDLAEVLWYGIPEPREGAPVGFFRLTGCGKPVSSPSNRRTSGRR